MKTKVQIVRLLTLCCAFSTASVLGQTTHTWTNAAGGDIATAANWNPNGIPSGLPSPGDTAQWDGLTTGPLAVTASTAFLPNTGLGTFGLRFVFTANQVSSVNFSSTASAGSALIGINNLSIASGAGAVTIGNSGGPGPGNTFLFNFVTRPSGLGVHNFLNDSANTAIINGGVRWLAGGGTVYALDFDGTGNWAVNNYLVTDNGAGIRIQKDGTGTMTLTPTGYLGIDAILSPAITVNAGELVLAGSHPRLGSQAIVNNATFQFNAPSQTQTLSGVISGTGLIQVSNGTLTLSGANTYTGNTLLSGGTLVVGSTENAGISGPLGVGTISFNGGTLGFNVNNVFDSSRFSTAASQPYRFDTGGQDITFTGGLSSSGGTLTKLGSGTLTFTGTSSYSGTTTVSAGKLVFQGARTGPGNITVADGAALSITASATQVTPGTLVLGTGGGAILEFGNLSSTTTKPLAATTLSSAGAVTINIRNSPLIPGQSYPLLSWSSGAAPAVSLGVLDNYIGNLSTNGNTIQLNITATAYKWTGNNNGTWDLVTPNNWMQNGGPAVFAGGGPVVFDDTAATNSVTLNALVQPTIVTVSNNAIAYRINSSGGSNIAGTASLTKQGSGGLTLSGDANSYTGITTISGGTLSVDTLANGGTASDIGSSDSGASDLVLDGGTLQYAGTAASSDRLFSLGTNGGTIDASGSGALNLSNPGSLGYTGGGAPRAFTLTGTNINDNLLAASIADNGKATTLTKSGLGKWVLAGSNTYSGGTTIAGGTLQIGTGGTSGSLGSGGVTNNGSLIFNRSDNLTNSSAIRGNGSLVKDGAGTLSLPGNNSYTGGTTISDGTLQVGLLDANSPITNNGTLVFNNTSPLTLLGPISGAGSLTKSGFGILTLAATNTYTGSNVVNGGTLFVNSDNHAVATMVSSSAGQSILGGIGTFYGPVTLNAGTALSPGDSAGSIGTLTVGNDLSIGSNLAIDVNRSLSLSNDFVIVTGLLTNTGSGFLTVANPGPALRVGDKFTLFSKPLQNGAAMTVAGAGAHWANNLAVDGSITVTAITQPTLQPIQSGGSLQFSWNTNIGAYKLQSQTNSISVGLSSNWVDYPGGNISPLTVPINADNPTVFFRLISP